MKEAFDIILMDDNFALIVKATVWGRSVNGAGYTFSSNEVLYLVLPEL